MKKRIMTLVTALILCALQGAWADDEPATVYRPADRAAKVYYLGDTGYLIEDYREYYNPDAVVEQARIFNEQMAKCPGVQSYVYLVNSSRTLDFDHLDQTLPLYTVLRESYPDSVVDCLSIKSVEEYCNYFYKTDHHWNYKGSYQGYTQIIRMMLGEDEPLLEPLETVVFPMNYNGSLCERMKRAISDEPFAAYRFEFPPMKVEFNGVKKTTYGKQEAYFKGKYNANQRMTNHYGEFYGGDWALVHLSTGDESKENLIVLSNSFSNAVTLPIASHFNNTYFVDLRHYKRTFHEKFSLSRAIKKWNVTKVLTLGDGAYFKSSLYYR